MWFTGDKIKKTPSNGGFYDQWAKNMGKNDCKPKGYTRTVFEKFSDTFIEIKPFAAHFVRRLNPKELLKLRGRDNDK